MRGDVGEMQQHGSMHLQTTIVSNIVSMLRIRSESNHTEILCLPCCADLGRLGTMVQCPHDPDCIQCATAFTSLLVIVSVSWPNKLQQDINSYKNKRGKQAHQDIFWQGQKANRGHTK